MKKEWFYLKGYLFEILFTIGLMVLYALVIVGMLL